MKQLTLIVALFSAFSMKAQELSKSQLNENWQLFSSNSGVNMYVRMVSCSNPYEKLPSDYLFVKMENLTKAAPQATFTIGMVYEEGCVGCAMENETSRSIVLDPVSTVECDCTFAHGELSYLIKNRNHVDDRTFTGIKLIDFNK